MGKRGPKPKSEQSKTRRGNPGRRPPKKKPIRERLDRRRQQLIGAPLMPRYAEFNTDAREMWWKIVAIMDNRLTISPDNGPLLELYCIAYADFRAARRVLRANGGLFQVTKNGYATQHAAVAVAKQAGESMTKAAEKLGLTPQMRETIDPVAQPDAQKPKTLTVEKKNPLDRDPKAPIDFSSAVSG